jgi:4-O-beta-D-mannosyl-D-glucose phosphorylase
MSASEFREELTRLVAQQDELLTRPNRPIVRTGGVYDRYAFPVITRDHVPLHWRYDLDESDNPFLLERLGVNSTFNPGAIEWNGKVRLIVRVEGVDRKSFFAIAESRSGIDNFRFPGKPLVIPLTEDPETNVYDMRLTQHEDGWIYGLFCAERKDASQPDDPSAARADCGIVRTNDMETWERLPDLVSKPQQRNVVLHPEFIAGKYALYTRPADSFISTGGQNGIGWALVDSMEHAVIVEEKIIDARVYHTVKEAKNGQGPTPIKTPAGWLHIAHGVRGHACGLRYVLYLFLTDLEAPSRVVYAPGGHFLSAHGDERRGDTTGNVFCNGAVKRENGDVLIYYGASDTRVNVVKSSVERLVDYCVNTPPDAGSSSECVRRRIALLDKNEALISQSDDPLLKTLLR